MVIKIKKKFLILFILLLAALFIILNIFLNYCIFMNHYKIDNSKISKSFEGYKIIQLSDIHSIRNKRKSETILKKVKRENPNLIVITGDLIDSGFYKDTLNILIKNGSTITHEALTIEFISELVKIAPTYYIYGNHEMILLDDIKNNQFKKSIIEVGINLINNEKTIIKINEEVINLIGIQDPSTLYKDANFNDCNNNKERIIKELNIVTENLDKNNFTILMSHRPEYMSLYLKYGVDLVLSGHAHGGQIRLPFIDGLYAPGQGWFPKYTKGLYKEENTQMIVSSGLGNSIAPIRIFNPFEIVVIEF